MAKKGSISFKLDTKAFDKRIREVGDKITRDAATNAMQRTLETITEEAKSLCPVDTGALKDSIDYELRETPKRGLIRGRVYADAPYAVYVHEDLEAYHPNGQAKFIEQPLYRHRNDLAANLREEIRKVK